MLNFNRHIAIGHIRRYSQRRENRKAGKSWRGGGTPNCTGSQSCPDSWLQSIPPTNLRKNSCRTSEHGGSSSKTGIHLSRAWSLKKQ